MKSIHWTIGAALALIGVALPATAPAAAQKPAKAEAKTPESWPYEIRDGRRVPKANRVVNPDGSWREEIRDGNCVTIREKTSKGEYRETRHC